MEIMSASPLTLVSCITKEGVAFIFECVLSSTTCIMDKDDYCNRGNACICKYLNL